MYNYTYMCTYKIDVHIHTAMYWRGFAQWAQCINFRHSCKRAKTMTSSSSLDFYRAPNSQCIIGPFSSGDLDYREDMGVERWMTVHLHCLWLVVELLLYHIWSIELTTFCCFLHQSLSSWYFGESTTRSLFVSVLLRSGNTLWRKPQSSPCCRRKGSVKIQGQ